MMAALTIACGAVLVIYPAFFLYGLSVPAPASRVGGFQDYLRFVASLVAIHGGVLIGLAILWVRASARRPVTSKGVISAGTWGAVAVTGAFIAGAGVRSMIAEGSFERGVGNLWGLVVIFAAVIGGVVAAGAALILRGVGNVSGAKSPYDDDQLRAG